MNKKLVSFILVLAMAVGILPAFSVGAWAEPVEPVTYLKPIYNTPDEPTSGLKEMTTAACTSYTSVPTTSSSNYIEWGTVSQETWYVIASDTDIKKTVKVYGDVHLILKDGYKLTVTASDGENECGGICVYAGNSLTIYAQSTGSAMGELVSNACGAGAGIGGTRLSAGDNITINGGKIVANGSENGAGIGSGGSGGGGANNITINGGMITASGSKGIGGASGVHNLTINGGTIIVVGGIGTISPTGAPSSNIFVDTSLTIKAGTTAMPSDIVCADRTNGTDIATNSDFAKQYVTIYPKHEHDWSYSLKDGTTNTIVATCTNADCDYDGTDYELPINTQGSLTYNEEAHNVTLSALSLAGAATPTDANITYEYKTTSSAYEPYETVTGTTNAGYYKATLNFAGVEAVLTYEVEKAEQTIVSPAVWETRTTSITLDDNVTAGHGKTKYAKNTSNVVPTDESAWQSERVFQGLTPGTIYYFFAKYEGDTNYKEAVSTGAKITTKEDSSSSSTSGTGTSGTSTGNSGIGGGDIFSGNTTKTIPVFDINVSDSNGGAVRVSNSSATEGTTVVVTVTPDKGFTTEYVYAHSASGNAIELYPLADGEKYSFTMPKSAVTITASFGEDNTILNYFIDIKASDYYYDAVLWAVENEITDGVDYMRFAPDEITNRAQMVTFLWRAAGCPVVDYIMPFTDVDEDEYYAEAVRWGASLGYVLGTSDTTFSPDEQITRAQALTFLWRYNGSIAFANMTASGPAASPYKDVATNAYYYNAVLWATGQKVTEGTSTATFSPDDSCTRAEVVTFLYRSVQ